jgi:predicted metalloprotease with PDZ domain
MNDGQQYFLTHTHKLMQLSSAQPYAQPYSIEQRDEHLLGTQANIRYHWHFDKAYRHLVRVVMDVDAVNTAQGLTLCLPVWIPGSYKVRDYISTLGGFAVRDAAGAPLASEWIAKNRLHIPSPAPSVQVEYTYYAFERDSTIRSSHVTRSHAFINPVTCCMMVEGREYELHHVVLHYDRSAWKTLSTALSPVKPSFADGEPVVLGALNYDIIVDSPVELGNHFTASFTYEGEHGSSVVETAIVGRGNYSAEWIAEQIETIVRTEATMWGGLPFDRYVFIIHLFPGMRAGGLEHARSSVNAMDSVAWNDTAKVHSLLSLLCHEFFHVWNIKRIRPRELGPFDYNRENLTRMLWLVEGATSYYDDLLTYRCGFYTREEYFKVLSKDHWGRFFRQPGRLQASIKDNSYQAWVKLYLPHDESVNQNVSYYLHGGLICMLLDFWIICESGGTKRLDDVFRVLWSLYNRRPATGITEEEFMDAAEGATGVDIRTRLSAWLNGREELPFEELFTRMGFVWKPTEKPSDEKPGAMKPMPLTQKLFTGLTLKTEGGKVLVTQVEEGTPASAATVGVDDEILAVNGVRVANADDVDLLLARRGTESASELLLAADAGLYTTTLTPVAQPEYTFAVSEVVSDEQQRLQAFWLER